MNSWLVVLAAVVVPPAVALCLPLPPVRCRRCCEALAAAILGGGLLLAHCLRRLRRSRQLPRIAEEKGRDTFRPGTQ